MTVSVSMVKQKRKFAGVVPFKEFDPTKIEDIEKMEEIGRGRRVIKGVIEVNCYESHLYADEADDWDICKLLQEDGNVKLVRGVPYLQLNPRNIEKLVSDDQSLYFKFKKPTTLGASREGQLHDDPRGLSKGWKPQSPGKKPPPGLKLLEARRMLEVTGADLEHKEEALDDYRKFVAEEKVEKLAELEERKAVGELPPAEEPAEVPEVEEPPEEVVKEVAPVVVGGRWMEPTAVAPSIQEVSLFDRAVRASENVSEEMKDSEEAELLYVFREMADMGETAETYTIPKDLRTEVESVIQRFEKVTPLSVREG